MDKQSKILVSGHNGLVGSALVRHLRAEGYTNLVTWSREEVDLTNAEMVKWAFSVHQPEYVFLAAARVGGIKDNAAHPLEFFLQNMAIETNVIMHSVEYGVKKLVFLGSSCIYPRDCPQPIKEEYLLTGPIEPTTEAYAIAKIAGVRMCQWLYKEHGLPYVSAMPCNLYGIRDNFHPENAHIIPGMMARLHQAKVRGDYTFNVWGDGTAMREFLYSDDLAQALLTVMLKYDDASIAINTGSSFELTVRQVAEIMAYIVGFEGDLHFDPAQPTGTPRKILDNSKIFALGWRPKTEFFESLRTTYRWYVANAT